MISQSDQVKAFNLYLNISICLLERFSWHLLQKMLVKSLLSSLARWGIKVIILNQRKNKEFLFKDWTQSPVHWNCSQGRRYSGGTQVISK